MKTPRINFFRREIHRKAFAALLMLALTSQSLQATTILTTKEVMNLLAMTQGTASTWESLNTLGYISGNQTFDIECTYSETGFSSSASGQFDSTTYIHTLTGSLSGEIGGNITISLNSTGMVNDTPFSTIGQMVWLYDADQNDYFSFEFSDEGEINPIWIPIAIGLGTGIIGGITANAVYDYFTTPSGDPAPPPQTITINGDFNGNIIMNSENVNINVTKGTGNTMGGTGGIPEPGIATMFFASLGLVGWRRRRCPMAVA